MKKIIAVLLLLALAGCHNQVSIPPPPAPVAAVPKPTAALRVVRAMPTETPVPYHKPIYETVPPEMAPGSRRRVSRSTRVVEVGPQSGPQSEPQSTLSDPTEIHMATTINRFITRLDNATTDSEVLDIEADANKMHDEFDQGINALIADRVSRGGPGISELEALELRSLELICDAARDRYKAIQPSPYPSTPMARQSQREEDAALEGARAADELRTNPNAYHARQKIATQNLMRDTQNLIRQDARR